MPSSATNSVTSEGWISASSLGLVRPEQEPGEQVGRDRGEPEAPRHEPERAEHGDRDGELGERHAPFSRSRHVAARPHRKERAFQPRDEDRREPLEHPRRVERLEAVVAAVDERVVAGLRIHRQPGLDRVPAVVAVDEVVHLVERPALGDLPPRALRTCAASPPHSSRQRAPGARQTLLVLRGLLLDLAQAKHVGIGPRAAARYASARERKFRRRRASRPPAQRDRAQVLLQRRMLTAISRRLRQHHPLPQDRIALGFLHPDIEALTSRATGRSTNASAARLRLRRPARPPAPCPRQRSSSRPRRSSDALADGEATAPHAALRAARSRRG